MFLKEAVRKPKGALLNSFSFFPRKFHKKLPLPEPFLINFTSSRHVTLLKRLGKGGLIWILKCFSERIFCRMPIKGCPSAFRADALKKSLSTVASEKRTLQMVVFERKRVINRKGRTNFNMANRFYNIQFYIWSLFFWILDEYGNVLAAEFDKNKG